MFDSPFRCRRWSRYPAVFVGCLLGFSVLGIQAADTSLPSAGSASSATPLPHNLPLPVLTPTASVTPSPTVTATPAKPGSKTKVFAKKPTPKVSTSPLPSPVSTPAAFLVNGDPDQTPPPLSVASPTPGTTASPVVPSPLSPSGASDNQLLPPRRVLPEADASLSRFTRVRRSELRVDSPVAIPVALNSEEGEGTLVSFPAPIKQINGFGVVYQQPAPTTRADFYLLWPGAATVGNSGAATATDDGEDDGTLSHFVVTGLRRGAKKLLSVVLQGQSRPYTIILVQTDGDNAALSVQFDFPASGPGDSTAGSSPGRTDLATAVSGTSVSGTPSLFPAGWDGARVPMSAARLDGLLYKIKGYPTLSKLSPDIYHGIETVEVPPGAVVDQWPSGLQVQLVRILRDHRLDALGFEARLTNLSHADFTYDPNALGVRVEASATDARGYAASARPADELYRARLTEASGRVVAGGTATVFFIVAGAEEGGTNELSPRNHFRLVLEASDAQTRTVAMTPRRPDRSKD